MRGIRCSLLVVAALAVVTLAGCPPRGPVLDVESNVHHFPCDELTGVCETTWDFDVFNRGTGTLVFDVTVSEPWINVTPTGGTISEGEPPVTVTVTIDRDFSNLKQAFPDFATGTITVMSDTGEEVITVTTAPNYYTQVFTNGGNDLDGLQLSFVPDGSLSFYGLLKNTGVTDFPTDPAGGQILPFDDPEFVDTYGDPVAVVPLGGKTVPFYGKNYDTLYVSSSGFVSFGVPGNLAADPAMHFQEPQISALPVDATRAGSMVSLLQDTQKVTVTYEDAPTRGTAPSPMTRNDFQIEMFFNGDIRITYANIDPSLEGVIGLSSGQGANGQVPEDFFATDLSEANTGSLKVSLE
ncbi:MAG: BACON domain-containing protein [Candidatus Hydrogenedentes bacterium]|nr:BACON domain-containing protein [Candidatus Hydrogenedentota bacterium]